MHFFVVFLVLFYFISWKENSIYKYGIHVPKFENSRKKTRRNNLMKISTNL